MTEHLNKVPLFWWQLLINVCSLSWFKMIFLSFLKGWMISSSWLNLRRNSLLRFVRAAAGGGGGGGGGEEFSILTYETEAFIVLWWQIFIFFFTSKAATVCLTEAHLGRFILWRRRTDGETRNPEPEESKARNTESVCFGCSYAHIWPTSPSRCVLLSHTWSCRDSPSNPTAVMTEHVKYLHLQQHTNGAPG